jgi:hypothetical protein
MEQTLAAEGFAVELPVVGWPALFSAEEEPLVRTAGAISLGGVTAPAIPSPAAVAAALQK